MNITIQQEQPIHYESVEHVIQQAFADEIHSDQTEHILVRRLRAGDAFIPQLSLVALNEAQRVVGHIMLSKISINNGQQHVLSLALAPVCVSPAYQRRGIGRMLIECALARAKELHYESVIVLGHPQYYAKFGFKRASTWRIYAPFPVQDETFMALPLRTDALEGVEGIVHYSDAFK